MDNKMNALLRYADTAPSPSQLDSIRKILSEKFENADIEIECQHDPEVGGGFIVTCGNFEYDWSDKGRAKQLRAELNTIKTGLGKADTGRIISMIKDKVDSFELSVTDREVGTVSWVGDGIANVEGIDHAFYGEIIEFEDGTKGMAQDIREDHVGCILLGSDKGIREGSRAVRTYKEAGVPVGEGFIGRVVDALGNPIDGLGDIKEAGYRAVEERSPESLRDSQ